MRCKSRNTRVRISQQNKLDAISKKIYLVVKQKYSEEYALGEKNTVYFKFMNDYYRFKENDIYINLIIS